MKLFEEIYRELLTEDKISSNTKKARNFLKANNYSQEQAQGIVNLAKEFFDNGRIQDCKYLMGICRMIINGEFGTLQQGELHSDNSMPFYEYTLEGGNAAKAGRFNKALEIIARENPEDYDFDLNGLSSDEIIIHYATLIDEILTQEKGARNQGKTFDAPSDYRIIPIPSFEEAQKYGRYTAPTSDMPGMQWCITTSPTYYNNYTRGEGIFYFCFKNGFENVPRQKTEGYPKDAYGVSLIAVSVTEDGSPNTITPRWNHGSPTDMTLTDAVGRSNSMFTVEELENILKVDFYATFKPRTPKKSIEEMLADGEPLENIFSSINSINGSENVVVSAVIRKANRYAIFQPTERRFVSEWYDELSQPDESGLMIAKLTHTENGGYYAIINANGENVINDTFDKVSKASDNGININGYYVIKDKKVNIITLNNGSAKAIFDNWVTAINPAVAPFDNARFLFVKDWQDGKIKINVCDITTGNLTLSEWVNDIRPSAKLSTYGFIAGYLYNGGETFYKLINPQSGKFVFNVWQNINLIKDKFNMGKLPISNQQGKYNFYNLATRQVISQQWFDEIVDTFRLSTRTATVVLNGRTVQINENGMPVGQQTTPQHPMPTQPVSPRPMAAPNRPHRKGF